MKLQTFKTSTSWKLLTIIVFIGLHLKVFTISNFDVSIGYLLIPIWFYKTFKIKALKFFKIELILFPILYFLPFLPMNITNWAEFFNTYFQFIISFYFAIRSIKKECIKDFREIDNTLYSVQIILLVTVLLQFVSLKFFSYPDLYNFFGKYQLYYELSPQLGKERMKAFYLEPSYLGLIVLNVFWTRLIFNGQEKLFSRNTIVTIIILIFTQSAFAYLSFSLIFLLHFKDAHFRRTSSIFYLISFSAFLILFPYLVEFFRLNEISSESTSGFFRMALPIKVMEELYKNNYFLGLTFGQLEKITTKIYGEYNAGTAMSNSFFLIMGYFGLMALAFYVGLLFKSIKTKNLVITSFILLTLLNLNNSGAFMTLQYVFITILIPILAIKYDREKNINYYRGPEGLEGPSANV